MIHACFLSKDCRRFGVIYRISFRVRGKYIALALHPRDRFAYTVSQDPLEVKSRWIDYR